MSTEQFKDLGHILNLSLRSNPDHEEITALYSEIQSNEPRKSRKNVDESEKRSFFFRVFVVVGMRVNNFLMNWIHPHTHLSTHTHTHTGTHKIAQHLILLTRSISLNRSRRCSSIAFANLIFCFFSVWGRL